jgi:ribonuclease D
MPDSIQIITSSGDLQALCSTIAGQPFVAVDTEFMRQTTYRPVLCLIQLAAPGVEALVDPLAEDLDLGAFYHLMADRSVEKVFHAARQDVEIIFQEAGVIPEPLFDTQIAAMALGFGEAISYGGLVSRLLRRNHDKTSQAANWTIRPMSRHQIEYALGDVTHLRDIYVRLRKRLEETGRECWLKEEVQLLTDPRTYAFDPKDAWKRMKIIGKSPAGQEVIKALAEWRERIAQEENVPRGRVLKDEVIYEIAKYLPRSAEALGRLRLARDLPRHRVTDIVAVTKTAISACSAPAEIAPLPAGLSPANAATLELLRVLLKAVSADLNVAPRLIASAEDLERLAMSDTPDIPALRGWRLEAFGCKALALKRGELALGVRDNRVAAVELPARVTPAEA